MAPQQGGATSVVDQQESPIRRGVLIVEDDADLRSTLGELLGASTIRPIFEAGSLEDVMGKVPDVLRCSLALLDIDLGKGSSSGVDVHNWLVAQHFCGQIFFMTGHARTHSLVRGAYAIDGMGVLRKPIDPRLLEGLALPMVPHDP
jgi:DNA-binding NtrC family response regulator